MWLRIFTLEEARALLPEVRAKAEEARRRHDEWKEAAAQRDDLAIIWGDDIRDPGCEDHAEWVERSAACDRLQQAVAEALRALEPTGVAWKDIEMGLVDFHALQGDRLVCLCWRIGEADILAWHSLQGGFAGRKPLPALAQDPAP